MADVICQPGGSYSRFSGAPRIALLAVLSKPLSYRPKDLDFSFGKGLCFVGAPAPYHRPEAWPNLRRRLDMFDLILISQDVQRFWSRVDQTDGPDACWPWTRGRFSFGYGEIRLHNRSWPSHRIVWLLTRGPIPDGLFVLHACDFPPCCNPKHLFLGTGKDNMQDAKQKGRLATGDRHPFRLRPEICLRGEANGAAKFTTIQILEIRTRCAKGETQTSVAKRFGIRQGYVSDIVRRRTWKHI